MFGKVLARLFVTGLCAAGLVHAQEQPLLLTNGKIITMDADESLATSLLIYRGRIIGVDDDSHPMLESARVLDLGGRTVIPGLYDSHMHFIRATLRPGHDMRGIEDTTSIAQLLQLIESTTENVPAGEFITGIGGWDPVQFAGENRFPTLQELDSVATRHPVYIHLRDAGPAVTNSLGKAILERAGIVVSEDGVVAEGNQSAAALQFLGSEQPEEGIGSAVAAFNFLKSQQSGADRSRGAVDFMRHANSLGLTAVRDQGGTTASGAQRFEPYEDYDVLLDLWRNDALTLRVRLMFVSADEHVGDGTGHSSAEQRLRNVFMGFGDDMLRVAGIGENIVTDSQGPAFVNVAKLSAQRGWTLEQHSSQPAENRAHIAAFEAANEVASIRDLRWSLTHVQQITPEIAQRLKNLNAGVTVQVHRYLNRGNLTNNQGGPPLRMLTDMGIPIGGGTDSTNAQAMNPWQSIAYMVTGLNAGGFAVNAGQELTRMEALRAYTMGSAWFSKDENDLGSLEVGKFADLAVLNEDYLSVSDSDIRHLRSLLTLVNGEVVYADAAAGLNSN